ncbi:MAG: hypothetical protein ACOC0J_02420, partial [Myxococcota bacterium]
WGRRRRYGTPREEPTLYVLQVRPAVVHDVAEDPRMQSLLPERVFCKSTLALGHGSYDDLRDIVYVRRDRFDPAQNPRIAGEVGKLDEALAAQERRYVLLGPGRWGSSDSSLGVPVQWSQISSAASIGYLTVPPGATRSKPIDGSFVDWDWLDSMPALKETEHLRWVRLERPMDAFVNGREGLGLIARPAESA